MRLDKTHAGIRQLLGPKSGKRYLLYFTGVYERPEESLHTSLIALRAACNDRLSNESRARQSTRLPWTAQFPKQDSQPISSTLETCGNRSYDTHPETWATSRLLLQVKGPKENMSGMLKHPVSYTGHYGIARRGDLAGRPTGVRQLQAPGCGKSKRASNTCLHLEATLPFWFRRLVVVHF